MKYLFLSFLCTIGCASEVDNKPAASVAEVKVEEKVEKTEPAPNEAEAEAAGWTQSAESTLEWVGAKVTGDHTGGFKSFEGKIDVDGGKLNSISINIQMNSVYSDHTKLTGHLLSEDFFDVEKHTTATFNSTSIEEKSVAGATHIIKGELELRGVKKALAFPATISISEGEVKVQSEFTINRMLWNIVYPGRSDDLIKEDVLIKSNIMYSK